MDGGALGALIEKNVKVRNEITICVILYLSADYVYFYF